MIHNYFKNNDYIDFLNSYYNKEHERKQQNHSKVKMIVTILSISLGVFSYLANNLPLVYKYNRILCFLIFIIFMIVIYTFFTIFNFLRKHFTEYSSFYLPTPKDIENDFQNLKKFHSENGSLLKNDFTSFVCIYYTNSIEKMISVNDSQSKEINVYFNKSITCTFLLTLVSIITVLSVFITSIPSGGEKLMSDKKTVQEQQIRPVPTPPREVRDDGSKVIKATK